MLERLPRNRFNVTQCLKPLSSGICRAYHLEIGKLKLVSVARVTFSEIISGLPGLCRLPGQGQVYDVLVVPALFLHMME